MNKITFIITNVQEDKKYKGAYARIFKILNQNNIFSEGVWETDESKGFENGVYELEINEMPDANDLETILKIKNVTLK